MTEYFVGAYKKKSYTRDPWNEPIYDEIFRSNSYQEAFEFALRWNLKGYTVEIQTAENDDIVDIETYKPYTMEKIGTDIGESMNRGMKIRIAE